ncbi:MAG: hypothetical protein KA436_10790 [Oligoflexales bacterium]|nr:hypothetical protein [Oligoflexales bacterium]
MREFLSKTSQTPFVAVEKLFQQLFEQEEAFSRALASSAMEGDFKIERRWQLHQFRNKIYDAFRIGDSTQAAHYLA